MTLEEYQKMRMQLEAEIRKLPNETSEIIGKLEVLERAFRMVLSDHSGGMIPIEERYKLYIDKARAEIEAEEKGVPE